MPEVALTMELGHFISPIPSVSTKGASIFPTLLGLETLAVAGRDFMPSRPLSLGRAAYRSLTSIGHVATRYLAACDVIGRNGALQAFPELSPVASSTEGSRTLLEGEGLFMCPVARGQGGWTLQPTVLPESLSRGLVPVWRQVQPDLPRHLPKMLPVPTAALDVPVWAALLRLKPLRLLWEKHLRRSHLITLLGLLPDAWLLDPTPLPPGAVIPRLELSSWEELPALRAAGPDYLLSSFQFASKGQVLGAKDTEEHWRARLLEALALPVSRRCVLTTLAPGEAETLCAVYLQEKGRVKYLGGFGTRPGLGGQREVFRVALA